MADQKDVPAELIRLSDAGEVAVGAMVITKDGGHWRWDGDKWSDYLHPAWDEKE